MAAFVSEAVNRNIWPIHLISDGVAGNPAAGSHGEPLSGSGDRTMHSVAALDTKANNHGGSLKGRKLLTEFFGVEDDSAE